MRYQPIGGEADGDRCEMGDDKDKYEQFPPSRRRHHHYYEASRTL